MTYAPALPTLLLTPQGWRVVTPLPGADVLSAQSWPTLEAREALRIAVESHFHPRGGLSHAL